MTEGDERDDPKGGGVAAKRLRYEEQINLTVPDSALMCKSKQDSYQPAKPWLWWMPREASWCWLQMCSRFPVTRTNWNW